MNTKWIVEIWKGQDYKKRRVFPTAEAAMKFSNDWMDTHSEKYLLQIISPTHRMYTVGVNGNDSAKWMK